MRPDTGDIRLVVNKIVRVVAVVFDAVQPQQTHPVRQLLVGNGVLLASVPVSGLQFKDAFLQRSRVATAWTSRVSQAWLASIGTDSISGIAMGTVQS